MPAIVYRVATETPAGWRWHCVWCHAEGVDYTMSWDAAVDQLMDTHTPQCKPYQRWFALYAVLERRAQRRRKRTTPVLYDTHWL
jgi:hypothetical protein